MWAGIVKKNFQSVQGWVRFEEADERKSICVKITRQM